MTDEIQEYSKTEAALSMLREKYTDTKYDVDTSDGLVEAKSGRSEIRGYRTSLEAMRKELKAPALERSRLIDTEAKRITAELVSLEQPIDQQIKACEARKEADRQAKIDAETKRVEDIQERIRELRGAIDVVTRYNSKASLIAEHIGDLEKITIDDSFDEFRDQADDAKIATLARLREIHAATVEREAEDARIKTEREELDRLRADAEKREAEARKQREAAEAKAREKREAEEQKQRDELEAQRKKQAKEQEQIDAENKRIADEREKLEREKAEAKRKAAVEKEAERRRKEKAQAAAKKAKYPGQRAILNALAEHFDVPHEVVQVWLTEIKKAA